MTTVQPHRSAFIQSKPLAFKVESFLLDFEPVTLKLEELGLDGEQQADGRVTLFLKSNKLVGDWLRAFLLGLLAEWLRQTAENVLHFR